MEFKAHSKRQRRGPPASPRTEMPSPSPLLPALAQLRESGSPGWSSPPLPHLAFPAPHN